MDKPSSTSSSSWAQLPLGALFAGALLLAGELGTRFFFKPPYVSLATYTRYYPQAPLYGSEGSRACFPVREEMSCAPTQDMNIIPQTFPLKKPAGERRIIVIGASISWEGARANSSVDNYPNRLMARLKSAHPASSLRLINLSVPGFGSTRQLVRFREALDYDADLFIIHTHDTNEVREDVRRAYVRSLHSGLAGKLLYASSVVVLKKWWSEQLGVPPPPPVATDREDAERDESPSAKGQRWLKGLEDNTKAMLALAKARSIPVILVGAGRVGAHDRPLNGFLSTQVNDHVQFLDVPPLFRDALQRNRRRLFKDNIHYTADGTRIVAAALAPLVERALPNLQH